MKFQSILILFFLASAGFTLFQCQEPTSDIQEAFAYPNPFSPSKIDESATDVQVEVNQVTTLSVTYIAQNATTLTFVIYNNIGEKVWSKQLMSYEGDEPSVETNTTTWSGHDDQGDLVDPGVYYCDIVLESRSTASKRITIWVN